MSYAVYCLADFGAHNDGLTVHGKLYNDAGTLVDTITTGVVEIADGLHWYTLDAPDGHAGAFILYNSADETQRRVFVVAPRETENADVPTSTRLADADYVAPPTVEGIADAIKALAVTGDRTLVDVLRNVWSVVVGDSIANDAFVPTSIEYAGADGDTDVTHEITDTERTVTYAAD